MSQVPDRGEPSTPGEINYGYIFQLLQELGYNKWIGCEYNPQGIINTCYVLNSEEASPLLFPFLFVRTNLLLQ